MKTLLLAACTFIVGAAMSQTFTWETTNTVETNLDQNQTVQYPLYLNAVGNDTVTLGIEVIYNDVPQSWDGMVCIYGQCLGNISPVGTQATMQPIYGSTQGMVRLTVNPFNGTEVATLQIYVYDVNFPNDGDTATWLLNTTVNTPELMAAEVSIAPNPVHDAFTIHSDYNMSQADIIDATGRIVRTVPLTNVQNKVNVADLPKGVYTARLSGNAGSIDKRFVKL
ncbi:MAG: T9SS type A sorting domain-containing protein [Fluviicola sp.]